jgi:predicted permease
MRLLRRLRYWLGQRTHDTALREELEFHAASKQQALETGGMSREDARFAARREMGNLTRAREDARAEWIWPWLESVWQDARLAVRALVRQPGFTLLAVIVLGIAIGLNASLFTVFAGAVLRPMVGVSDPGRLVVVSGRFPERPELRSGAPFPEFEFLAANSQQAELAAERGSALALDIGRGARVTDAHFVTGNYFELLGVRMHLGRGILPNDDMRGESAPVVVVSYELWQTRFGGDSSILGRTVHVGPFVPNAPSTVSEPLTVVGVAPRGFTGGDGPPSQVWLPVSSVPRVAGSEIDLDRPQWCCFEVYGRLKPDATREQLTTELQLLSDRFRPAAGLAVRTIVLSGTQVFRGRRGDADALTVIGLLFLGITLVLALACANVGNLLLARAASRRSEIAVRLSLGAGRARLVRSLLTEGFVLALLAALAGFAIAAWLPPFILNTLVERPAPFDIRPDALVLAYVIALAALACLACALAPALHATRGTVMAALKGSAPFVANTRLALRSVLLAVQVAMTVVLLASAGLLFRGIATARTLDPGFPVDDISQAEIGFPQPEYDAHRLRALLPDVAEGLAASGLRSFALATLGFRTEEARRPGDDWTRSVALNSTLVSPSYFEVMGVPLTAGRGFAESDRDRDVVIVNEALARQFWGQDNPVGRPLEMRTRTFEVVGVVRDARLFGLGTVAPFYFEPLWEPWGSMFPAVLFRNQPSADAAIRGAVARLEPRARVTVIPLRSQLEGALEPLRLAPIAASTLATFALGLATVGMFGAFAFAVRMRTREIGIRVALGAPQREIVRSVLAGSSTALALGLVAGVLGALGASQLLRSVLYGLSPLDPITYAGVGLILAMSAILASYVPARRALRLDAATILRAE